MNQYFVNKDNRFLWKDGNFYPAFEKSAYGVDEEVAKHYESLGCEIEYAEPSKWPSLYPEDEKTRRTYVRCAAFALAEVLDRLQDTDNVHNIWVSLEDSDFLVSFEFRRLYERSRMSIEDSVPQCGTK